MLRFGTHVIPRVPEVLPKPIFSTLEEALRRSGTSAGAAELHGALCGLACADPGGTANAWVEQILPQDEPVGPEVRPALVELAEHTRTILGRADGSFAPLLPEEETGLEYCSASLASWCQGFLYGLGLGGLGEAEILPAETAEIIDRHE